MDGTPSGSRRFRLSWDHEEAVARALHAFDLAEAGTWSGFALAIEQARFR